ncbi:MAG: hypothetical protein LUC44_00395 [Prevotellaceae bacterium]|nr:hypothetical protein [Prevotellaceae bacterium]
MMKRLSMFVAMACLGLALPMYADDAVEAGQTTVTWTAPRASVSEGSSLTDGGEYYLYNVGAKMFYTNGNDYGTEASFGSTGLKVTLTDKTSGYTICYDSSKYLYYDYNGTYGPHFWYDGTYTEGSTVALFTIEETEDGSKVYTIKSLATDEKNTDVTIGYLGYEEGSTEIAINVDEDSENAQWLLVSADDYDAACQALVDMRVYLNNALTDAQELGLQEEDDFLAGVAAYNSAESEQTDIDDATAALATLIQENGTASGDIFEYTTTDANGVETTQTYRVIGQNLVTNPSFEYGFTGWTKASDYSTTISDGFELKNQDAADGDYYLVGTSTSSNSGTAGTSGTSSLGTKWAIEGGKTYFFSYETKALTSDFGTDTSAFQTTSVTGTDENQDATSTNLLDPAISAISTDWTQLQTVFTAASTDEYLQIDCRWLKSRWGFDNFVLYEVELLEEDNEDVTSQYITNADCSISDTKDSDFGWVEDPDNNFENKYRGFIHATGTDPANWFEGWTESYNSLSDRSLTQTISLPAGEYRLTADAVANKQNEPLDYVTGVYLIAGDEQTNVYTEEDVWSTFSVDFAVETEEGEETADVTIGFKTVSSDASWVGVTNFTLTYLGEVETHDLLALKELIEEAQALADENGEGAEDLQAAIDEAQAVLDDADSDAEALESAISSLKEAIELYKVKNAEEDLLGVWQGQDAIYNGFITQHYDDTDTDEDGESLGTTAVGIILTQTITDLPVGTYEVQIYCSANYANHWTSEPDGTPIEPSGASEGDEVVTITANGVTQAVELGLMSAGNPDSQYNITSLNDVKVYTLSNVVVDESGKISLSISVDVAGAVNWVLALTKSVTYTGEAPSYEDLEEALEEAEPYVANVGDAAFQISTTDAADILEAIETAEALDETAAVSEIVAALTALTSATEAFEEGFDSFVLNAPNTDQVFNIIMMTEDTGVTGNALESIYDADKSNGGKYDFQFTAEPNANLATQLYTFTPVEDVTNGYTISFVASDGNTYYLCAATEYSGQSNADGIRATDGTSTTADNALTVVVKATTTEGVWNLYNPTQQNNLGLTTDNVSIAGNCSRDALALTEAPSEIEWTLSEEYGTLVLPFVPDENEISSLTFYSTEAYDEDSDSETTLKLVEVEADDLEAGVPYLVSGDADTYTFAVTARSFDTSATAGWLTGVYVPTSVPTASYVLQNGDEGLAFYTVTTDDPITLGANHCYLTVSTTTDDTTGDTTNAPAVIFFPNGNGTPTAITAVEANVAEAEAVYDLSGRKVSQAQKGIYIKGGKKVVIK